MAATQKSTPATTVATKATPKAAPKTDYTYLETKAPSDLHVRMAEFFTAESGLEVTPKQVQIVLGLHGVYQRSEENKQANAAKAASAATKKSQREQAARAKFLEQAAKLGLEVTSK